MDGVQINEKVTNRGKLNEPFPKILSARVFRGSCAISFGKVPVKIHTVTLGVSVVPHILPPHPVLLPAVLVTVRIGDRNLTRPKCSVVARDWGFYA